MSNMYVVQLHYTTYTGVDNNNNYKYVLWYKRYHYVLVHYRIAFLPITFKFHIFYSHYCSFFRWMQTFFMKNSFNESNMAYFIKFY